MPLAARTLNEVFSFVIYLYNAGKMVSGLASWPSDLVGVIILRFFNRFSFLVDLKQGRLKYILKAAAVTLGLGIPLALTLRAIFPSVRAVDFDPADDLFLLLFIGPTLETFMMGIIFFLIKPITKNLFTTCLISAALWSVIHGVSAPLQGIVNFFNFLIFSIAFQVWKEKSYWSGFNVALSIHIFHNAGVTAFVLFVGRFIH